MTEIEIPEEIKEKKQKKEKKEKRVSLPKKLMKSMAINKPHLESKQMIIPDSVIERHYNPIPEIKDGSKMLIFKAMSFPAKDKKNVLETKLKQSEYINKYLDHNIYLNYVDAFNSHVKFGLCYAYYYIDCMMN
jgi:hypothetical protein